MSYLARLKSLNPVMRPPGKPSKPSKAPFEGFEGTYGPGVAENTTALHSAASECAGHLWSTGDGDEAERAAIIEYDGCVPRELAEALARLLSSPPLAGEAPTHWRARIDQAARLCDAQAARALTSGVLANTHQGKP